MNSVVTWVLCATILIGNSKLIWVWEFQLSLVCIIKEGQFANLRIAHIVNIIALVITKVYNVYCRFFQFTFSYHELFYLCLYAVLQFGSPEVSVVVVSPKARESNNVIHVPLQAEMTVLDAFIAATRTYIEQHGQSDDIPFNVMLDWNPELRCFTIVKALGFHSRRRSVWFMAVSNGSQQVIETHL